ncbi:hypothetical protein GGR51DRAFT_560725 [Nemania sp. FL0031]|nr:hypothetical protein GGR51DRAFT_560725 [Nemania sp. FL0031]
MPSGPEPRPASIQKDGRHRHTGDLVEKPERTINSDKQEIVEIGSVMKWDCCCVEDHELPDMTLHKNEITKCKLWFHEPKEGACPPVDTWDEFNLETPKAGEKKVDKSRNSAIDGDDDSGDSSDDDDDSDDDGDGDGDGDGDDDNDDDVDDEEEYCEDSK